MFATVNTIFKGIFFILISSLPPRDPRYNQNMFLLLITRCGLGIHLREFLTTRFLIPVLESSSTYFLCSNSPSKYTWHLFWYPHSPWRNSPQLFRAHTKCWNIHSMKFSRIVVLGISCRQTLSNNLYRGYIHTRNRLWFHLVIFCILLQPCLDHTIGKLF